MDIKPIRTEEDYRATLQEIESLTMAEPGTLDSERLDVLTTLVEAWARKHYPLDLPDPVETEARFKDLIRQLAARAPAEDITDANIDRGSAGGAQRLES